MIRVSAMRPTRSRQFSCTCAHGQKLCQDTRVFRVSHAPHQVRLLLHLRSDTRQKVRSQARPRARPVGKFYPYTPAAPDTRRMPRVAFRFLHSHPYHESQGP